MLQPVRPQNHNFLDGNNCESALPCCRRLSCQLRAHFVGEWLLQTGDE